MDAKTLAGEVHRLHLEAMQALGPWAEDLIVESNRLASQRTLEENSMLQTLISLQRHHLSIRSRLSHGEPVRKPSAFLLKAFRLATHIERLRLADLLRQEAEIGEFAPVVDGGSVKGRVAISGEAGRRRKPEKGGEIASSAGRYMTERIRNRDSVGKPALTTAENTAFGKGLRPKEESTNWTEFTEARNRGDVQALVNFVHSSVKVKSRFQQKEEWVPPTSIGGHAVNALADLCQKRELEVAKALENDIHRIVEYIDSRNLELQDPSIVLLYHVSPSLSPSLKDRIINIGGFNGLLKVMRSGSKLKRQTAAETCRMLYEGSEVRKDKFVALDGITTLVHVMNMDRDDPDFVHNSLLRFYELTLVRTIKDESDNENHARIQRLNQANVLETIGTLDLSKARARQVSGDTVELIEKLTQMLQSDCASHDDSSPFS